MRASSVLPPKSGCFGTPKRNATGASSLRGQLHAQQARTPAFGRAALVPQHHRRLRLHVLRHEDLQLVVPLDVVPRLRDEVDVVDGARVVRRSCPVSFQVNDSSAFET